MNLFSILTILLLSLCFLQTQSQSQSNSPDVDYFDQIEQMFINEKSFQATSVCAHCPDIFLISQTSYEETVDVGSTRASRGCQGE